MKGFGTTLGPAPAGKSAGMSWASRVAVLALALAAICVVPALASANEAGNLDQCGNGPVASPNSCPPGWQNGNLNENGSHYAELDSVPFRISLTGLTAGSHTLVIQYDAIQSTKHAYDYLTSFGRTVAGVDPCDGIATCSGSPTLADLPLDPRVNAAGWGGTPLPQSLRQVAGWNVTGLSAALGGDADTSDQQSVTFTFTTSGSDTTAVLAWGGHIGSQINWGAGNAAGNIPGSPYHMRFIALDGAGGNQDRSLKASALTPVLPGFFTDVQGVDANGNVSLGSSVTDLASLTGVLSNGAPSGSVQFAVCGPNTSNPDCSTVANQPSTVLTPDSPVVVLALSGSAVSPSFQPTAAGHYCFRAIYTPDAFAIYSPTEHTNQITETSDSSVHGECFTVTPAAPSLSTSGSASVTVGGTIHDTVTLSGGSSPTGSITVNLYAPSDASCSTVIDHDTITVPGSGSPYTSKNFATSQAGTYHFIASYSGDNNNAPATGHCGDAGESVDVTQAHPSISTSASATVAVGQSIHDTVTFTGGSSPTGTITVSLYAPSDATCSTSIDHDTITVPGTGSPYTSKNFATSQAGTYRFIASYSGDANNAATAGQCGAEGESVAVTKAQPTITTLLSASSVAVGAAVSDSATLTGATSDAGGTVTYHVYDNNQCSGDGRLAAVVNVTNGSVPLSALLDFNTAGDFYWQAVYSGDGNNAGATSVCTEEHLIVGKATPTLSTTASDNVVLGGELSDVAHFDGGFNVPQGTLTFTAYGPNDSECTGDPVFTSEPISVDGSGDYDSGSFTPAAAGTYNWVVTYSGDGNNNAVTEPCGSEGESTTVSNPSISIAKGPDSQSISSGGTASFTITVTNTGGVSLADVSVTDAQAPNCAKSDLGSLDPGQSTSYTCSLAGVTSSFTNSATATGHPEVGPPVTATDTAGVTVNAVPPPPPPPPPVIPAPPAPVIDLQITKTDNPDPDVLGNKLRYLITVKNNGPDTAHNVQMSDPLPFQVSFSSVATTQGTCTGGQLVSCQLGTINSGASVVITVFVKTSSTGLVTNTATTVGQETESNTANNTATTTTLVKGPFTPPVITGCYAVAVAPHSLTAGKRSTLTLSVHTLGKPAKGLRVRVTGAGIRKTSGRTNARGIVRMSVKPAKPGILRFQPLAVKGCAVPRIGVIGAFTPPVTG